MKLIQFFLCMFINLETELLCYNQYNLSPNELLFLRMLLLCQAEDPEEKKYFITYMQLPESCRGNIREMLVILQAKGYILKNYKIPEKGQQFDPVNIPFNQKMVNKLYKASYQMGKELYDVYPLSCIVNECEYKLKRISNKFDTLEDAYRYYGQAIRNDNMTHEQIIKLIKWGKDNGYQFTTLGAFLADHDWNNILSMQKESILNNSYMKMV